MIVELPPGVQIARKNPWTPRRAAFTASRGKRGDEE
jgi:hypothetical protein